MACVSATGEPQLHDVEVLSLDTRSAGVGMHIKMGRYQDRSQPLQALTARFYRKTTEWTGEPYSAGAEGRHEPLASTQFSPGMPQFALVPEH